MRNLTIILVLIVSSLSPSFFGSVEAAASVIMKILVVNPPQTETETVPVKVYLPKEVSPKDIIDLGDLKLDYDPEKGMYYVHNEVELGPGQSMIKMVEMEDIWVFTEEELSSFGNQAKEMASGLGGTPHTEEAAVLVLGIEQKVEGILKMQEQTAADPARHIRAYRGAIIIIASIEKDLSTLERLMQMASEGEGEEKGPPVEGALLDSEGSPSTGFQGAGEAENKFEGLQETPSHQQGYDRGEPE